MAQSIKDSYEAFCGIVVAICSKKKEVFFLSFWWTSGFLDIPISSSAVSLMEDGFFLVIMHDKQNHNKLTVF